MILKNEQNKCIKLDHKYTIKIVSLAAIGSNKQITITRLIDLLRIKDGDELLYILNENGQFSLRKSNKKLSPKEKYISVNKVRLSRHGMVSTVPRDIIDALDLKFGDNLVFILDDNDIIIKSPILSDRCELNGLIIGLTILSPNQITTFPEIARDLIFVETGDMVVFVKKDCNIVLKSIEEIYRKLNVLGMAKLGIRLQIYLKKEIINMIDPKDTQILWILNKNGDIIIRNTILPKLCFDLKIDKI